MRNKDDVLIPVGDRLPRRGGGFLPWLGVFLLRLFGWRVTGELPNVARAVVIVAPHTSNWDGVFGLSAIQALKLRVNALGKDTLFVGPLGWLLGTIGVIPVDRTSPQGMVRQIVERFRQTPAMFLAIAPEGTRHAAERWKTGFYQIALEAGVPIILVAFDYSRREVRVMGSLQPGGDQEADLERIYAHYRGVPACNPELLSLPLRQNSH
ncbi:MAG: lysophospholipid acyltransferase family protein [Alcanivoracaceae bacterium]|jgi:1-acyl-sn-glycerol-3-phosphate acyltransferase|nr:lysophospholipid acyltransferase family protein [Alcanivoracaceae bacterium]